MAAIQQQEQNAANRWYTWIEIRAGESLMLITQHQVTEAEGLDIQTRHIDAHLYDDTPHASIDLYENKELLRTAMLYLKNNNPNAQQFTTMLNNNVAWYEAYMVRYFLAALALKLAERGGVSIDTFTEAEVIPGMNTWPQARPLGEVYKIRFGEP